MNRIPGISRWKEVSSLKELSYETAISPRIPRHLTFVE